MRLTIGAVGVAKSGPEADLTSDYLKRAQRAGRGVGFQDVSLNAIPFRDDANGVRKADEALAAIAEAADFAFLLDEGGDDWSSRDLARFLEKQRDGGSRECAFLIGPPDGHGPKARIAAQDSLRFGRATWPHMLVRVMLAEQLYRAVGILSGSPYHRD